MGQPLYRTCRGCGKSSAEVGELSWTRQCPSCGEGNLLENIEAMTTKHGPGWLKWRRAMAACVGGVIVDHPVPQSHTRS